MELSDYKPEFYKEIASWWGVHKDWESVPEFLLPTTGLVVRDCDTLLAAGFLYVDGTSPVCWMEWIVANPENSARTSIKALKELVAGFARYADEWGKVLMTTLRQPRLAGLYSGAGFIEADTGMTNMTRLPNGSNN